MFKLNPTFNNGIRYNTKALLNIFTMFPDVCPYYVRMLCLGQANNAFDQNQVLDSLLSLDYPKDHSGILNKDSLGEYLNVIKNHFPDANLNFWRNFAVNYPHTKNKLLECILSTVEKENYPIIKKSEGCNTDMLQHIFKTFPDACPYYIRILCLGRGNNASDLDQILEHLLNVDYPENQPCILDMNSLEEYLSIIRNHFPDADLSYWRDVAVLYKDDKNKLLECILNNMENGSCPLIKKSESMRKNGQYHTCNCCYDDEVEFRDVGICEDGCVFCKSCIQKSVEVVFGQGKLNFPCLLGCSSFFTLEILEDVLPRTLYDKITQKKQIEEVTAAKIEDLEICPFCDFAMIPVKEDNIFRCQNAECLKESCRLCKRLAHVPLRCDESQQPDNLQKRIYIENEMSEALIRVCYQCGLRFIKSEGCNKMKCSCGAMMCYLCGKPVSDYKHFNGQGGDNYHLCPLFNDTDKLHEINVAEGEERARLHISLNKDISNASDIVEYSEVIEDLSPPLPPTGYKKKKSQLNASDIAEYAELSEELSGDVCPPLPPRRYKDKKQTLSSRITRQFSFRKPRNNNITYV